MQEGQIVNVIGYLSDVHKEGSIYNGPSFVELTKDDVIPIFDKWEEEVRVITQVFSFYLISISI